VHPQQQQQLRAGAFVSRKLATKNHTALTLKSRLPVTFVQNLKKLLQGIIHDNGLAKSGKAGHSFTAGKVLEPAGGRTGNSRVEQPGIVRFKYLANSPNRCFHDRINILLPGDYIGKEFELMQGKIAHMAKSDWC
jgi:hypothetical protein